jgi:hemoglobin
VHRDIETREDVEQLVRAFYGRAMDDPMIGYLFTDIAHLDLEAHVPVITSFWETMLLGARSYGGGAFGVHAELHLKSPLRRAHFDRWLALWEQSVDERHAGQRADLAKHHARRVARAFHQRLSGRAWEAEEPQRSGPLPLTLHGKG